MDWLYQNDILATRAPDLQTVGEHACPALWTARLLMVAAYELERAKVLDEAIRLVLIRLPTDVVV